MRRAGNIGFARAVAVVVVAAAVLLVAGEIAHAHARTDAVGNGDGKMVTPVVMRALQRGLTIPGARIDAAWEGTVARGADCRAVDAELLRPIEGSGRIAGKVSGHSSRGGSCEAWTWVQIRVVAPVAIAARALAAGERLDGATAIEERELRAGHAPATIGPLSVATRALLAGQALEAALVSEPTVRLGQPIKVLIVSGALVIEQSGRGAPCGRGRSCATLASGKQVEGDLVDGKLVVQSP